MTPGNTSATPAPASVPNAGRAAAPTAPATAPATGERAGRGGRGGGEGRGGFGGGGGGGDFQGRMLERFKTMSPDEQKAFIARMKERGQDTTAFEAGAPRPAAKSPRAAAPAQQAQTIDALFAPLPTVESRGRAWLFMDRQLKPVNLRLGISDGTNTELLSEELQENMEVVTGVTGLTSTRATPQSGAGNPLMPGRGGPGGPGRGGAPQGGRGR